MRRERRSRGGQNPAEREIKPAYGIRLTQGLPFLFLYALRIRWHRYAWRCMAMHGDSDVVLVLENEPEFSGTKPDVVLHALPGYDIGNLLWWDRWASPAKESQTIL